jgi:phytoene dehydrogenase-like protein
MKGKKVPEENCDAIIIGSGIGGLSCAASLAMCNYTVLVLEKKYVPRGISEHLYRT